MCAKTLVHGKTITSPQPGPLPSPYPLADTRRKKHHSDFRTIEEKSRSITNCALIGLEAFFQGADGGQGVLPQTPLCSTGTCSFQVYVQILHVVDMPLDNLGAHFLIHLVFGRGQRGLSEDLPGKTQISTNQFLKNAHLD